MAAAPYILLSTATPTTTAAAEAGHNEADDPHTIAIGIVAHYTVHYWIGLWVNIVWSGVDVKLRCVALVCSGA
jgi:hypothetical protein